MDDLGIKFHVHHLRFDFIGQLNQLIVGGKQQAIAFQLQFVQLFHLLGFAFEQLIHQAFGFINQSLLRFNRRLALAVFFNMRLGNIACVLREGADFGVVLLHIVPFQLGEHIGAAFFQESSIGNQLPEEFFSLGVHQQRRLGLEILKRADDAGK